MCIRDSLLPVPTIIVQIRYFCPFKVSNDCTHSCFTQFIEHKLSSAMDVGFTTMLSPKVIYKPTFFGPVSYTHLDVYKRQMHTRLDCLRPRFCLHLQHKTDRAAPTLPHARAITSVSYTHLDVYKRQLCAFAQNTLHHSQPNGYKEETQESYPISFSKVPGRPPANATQGALRCIR